MEVADDLFLGNFNGAQGALPVRQSSENPTAQVGAGPMGRIAFYDIVPKTVETANIAALQASTSGTALTLTAGTGVTAQAAPDGSGATVYAFDVPRCVSLTSAADLATVNYLITGYDTFGRLTTDLLAGPNVNTVHTLKAFASVLSIVPQATNASTVSAGSADVFGLPWAITDAGYIVSNKWAGALAQDAGTLTVADTTSPATDATGDPRGTYAPSSASNGTNRLVIGAHLTAAQCGSNPTVTALIGVTPA